MKPELKWFRCSKANPCMVCKRVDWCTFSALGSCCMRVESAKPMKNGGWLHGEKIEAKVFERLPLAPVPPRINAPALMHRYAADTITDDLMDLASDLGVTYESLFDLGFAWSSEHRAFACPMRDGMGAVCGIQLRFHGGEKRCVTGSNLGMFVPKLRASARRLYVCEGASDCAALLSMGVLAIGRPSCSSRTDWIVQTVMRLDVREVVIVADNDEHEAGLRGAEALSKVLPVPNTIWLPPCKDAREFKNSGGSASTIDSCVRQLLWNSPSL